MTQASTATNKAPASIPPTDAHITIPDEDTILILRPQDIAINPKIRDLGNRDRSTPEYKTGIGQLAKTMAEEGQKQNIVVRSNTQGGDQSYELVLGHRRWEAAKLNKTTLRATFEDLDDTTALRGALIENFQREDWSPLERALIMVEIRAQFCAGATTPDANKFVAEFLGVSLATITQTLKILDLDKKIQEQVDTGQITPATALEYAAVEDTSKLPEVIKRAEKAAAAEHKKKIADGKAKGGKAAKKAASKEKEKPKVQGKHVKQSIRDTPGASAKPKAPGRAQIISMFEKLSGPVFHPAMSDLADSWIQWIGGKLSDKKLQGEWDKVSGMLPKLKAGAIKHTEEEADTAPAAAAPTAKKKAEGKKPAKKK